jgi:hypothetical protein
MMEINYLFVSQDYSKVKLSRHLGRQNKHLAKKSDSLGVFGEKIIIKNRCHTEVQKYYESGYKRTKEGIFVRL